MNRVADEKSSMYFNFDAGEVEFGGEKAIVKGSLLFDFVHEFRQPNVAAIQEITMQLKKWLEDHIRGSPKFLDDCRSLLKLCAVTLGHIQPDTYTRNMEDKIGMRKGFWLAVLDVVEWITDNSDDQPKYRQDPNFHKMVKFFSSTLYKIYSFQFSDKEELQIHVEEFGLFKNYPKFYDLFNLWFDFAQTFYADPLMQECGLTKKKMVIMGEALEQQYMSNSWMDGAGLEKVDSFNLYSFHRRHNSGAWTQYTMCAIMDGFHDPELNYIFRNHYVEHFTFLCLTPLELVHDLVSFKKDLRAGETNNVILMWVRKGKNLQESVDKGIKKHDQLLGKAKELYNFIQKEYKNDPKLLGYVESVLRAFSGICQYQALAASERYSNFKWSIDPEPNA